MLASTSEFRKKQLTDLGYAPIIVTPKFDEEAHKDDSLKPDEYTRSLAIKKAASMRAEFSDHIIIAADQTVYFQGHYFGKSKSHQQALDQLHMLNGQTHELYTSVCVIKGDVEWAHTDRTVLTMKTLKLQELANYIRYDDSQGCAGAYKIEKAGLCLFEKIQTEDHSSIIGLPIMRLTKILMHLGAAPPCLNM